MDEQSPNGRQPKVKRTGSGSAEEPRPSVRQAGSTGEAENVSEKLSQVGEEVSLATNRQVESVLRWPFQTTQHVAEEWTHFFGRALERNSRAAADLRSCTSVASLLRWQWDLVQSNGKDWLETSFAVFGVFCAEGSAKAATETGA